MKLGIVGTNFISDRIAEASRRVCGIELAAVYSRKYDTGRVFADKWGIKNVFCDLEKMLNSGQIDALYVASPTMCHLEHTEAAIRARVPVLCEKMLVATYDEAKHLDSVRRECDGIVVEAMRPAFDSRLAFVRKNIGLLGNVWHAELEFCQYSSRYDAFLAGDIKNAFDPGMKNSALADIGIYPLYYAISLFGDPKSIDARGSFLHNGFLGEGDITLDYGAFDVHISYSKIREGKNVSFIEGDGGRCDFGRINEPDFARFILSDGTVKESLRSSTESNFDRELCTFADIVERSADHKHLWSTSMAVMKAVGCIYSLLGIDFDN